MSCASNAHIKWYLTFHPELRPRIRHLPPLESLRSLTDTRLLLPQNLLSLRNALGFFNLALGARYTPAIIHDRKMQRHRKYNSTHRPFLRVLSFLLHPALVTAILVRIYKWNELVMISFVAGIFQTVFYADFIYYFIKSNQN